MYNTKQDFNYMPRNSISWSTTRPHRLCLIMESPSKERDIFHRYTGSPSKSETRIYINMSTYCKDLFTGNSIDRLNNK